MKIVIGLMAIVAASIVAGVHASNEVTSYVEVRVMEQLSTSQTQQMQFDRIVANHSGPLASSEDTAYAVTGAAEENIGISVYDSASGSADLALLESASGGSMVVSLTAPASAMLSTEGQVEFSVSGLIEADQFPASEGVYSGSFQLIVSYID